MRTLAFVLLWKALLVGSAWSATMVVSGWFIARPNAGPEEFSGSFVIRLDDAVIASTGQSGYRTGALDSLVLSTTSISGTETYGSLTFRDGVLSELIIGNILNSDGSISAHTDGVIEAFSFSVHNLNGFFPRATYFSSGLTDQADDGTWVTGIALGTNEDKSILSAIVTTDVVPEPVSSLLVLAALLLHVGNRRR